MSSARQPQAAPRLWIHLAGTMQAMDAAGQNVLPRSRKARAVLAILAVASPKPVSRARITGLLWSQREREQARGSLRQCVHEIQGLLQSIAPGVLEADREQLRIVEDALWLDLRELGPRTEGVPFENLMGLDPAFDAWAIAEQSPSPPQARPAFVQDRVARLGVRHLRALGGEDETALAEGLGDELAVALSRFRWLPAIAPDAVASAASEAEFEYLLDGTVRRISGRIRVALRVQDMRTGGEVIWARNFDDTAADLLSFHDRIVEQAAAQVDPEILLREGARAASRLDSSPRSAGALTLAAVVEVLRLERDGFARAGVMLEEAVRLSPDSPMAHAWLAYWHVLASGQGWEKVPGSAMARAATLAERAIALDPSDGRALAIAGHVRSFLGGQVKEALVLHDRALALNPSLAWAWMMSGLAFSYAGEHSEAIARMECARRLSPFDPHAFFFDNSLMLPYAMLGEYEHVTDLGRLTTQLKPNFSASWKMLLVGMGHMGRMTEAAEVRGRLQALEPGFSIRSAMARSPLRRPEDRARYAEGLRLGGLEE